MATAAEQSTEFYGTFSARLTSLQDRVNASSSSQDLDGVVQAVIESRGVLQEKDLEGHLSNRDRESYERVSAGSGLWQ